ncbi:pentatricopeptide repeat-containing protein at1g02150-like protein [Trifolium pratense]|uniref:Pentatricopeptide repeat-containing protein at1g02150-like protein n=1 Tax=Trifolium pratense TaxID=57577 RepID=A0A2K3PC92_TRIPR|nr:pentatricopeptide repeat-containing protein at1g02150-like protein [Trifolium pratense]
MMTPLQIQSSLQNQSFSLSLSSSICYSNTLPFKQRVSVCYTYSVRAISVTCSISKTHNHDTVDFERRPIAKWFVLYKRISMMKNPELGSASVLNQWENEGKTLTKWELCRIVKELRKYRKHHSALQVVMLCSVRYYVANMRGGGMEYDKIVAKANDFTLWKFLANSWLELSKHQFWSIGNGVSVDPWTSCWLKEGYHIVDMVEDVPLEWKNIKGEDKRLCPGNGRGAYTVSSAYRLMSNEDGIAAVHNDTVHWNALSAITCHYLWNWKSKEAHDNTFVRPPEQWIMTKCMAVDYVQAASIAYNMRTHTTQVLVRWEPPAPGWIKLNTDGACKSNGDAGCGGLIRVESELLGDFSKYIGRCNAFVAELWGVLEGLKLARTKGFTHIEMLYMAFGLDRNFMVYDVCPVQLKDRVDADARGAQTPWLIPVLNCKLQLCSFRVNPLRHEYDSTTSIVYEWMNNRPERFTISSSDAAIQLDLIAKAHGVSSAEGFFLNLTNNLKDRRTYCALLNVYVHSRLKNKAEFLLDVMRSKRYLIHSLPFNLMMNLYTNLKDYGKVDMLVSEMKEKNIQLDLYTYNIWLTSCGSQESIEKMEHVIEQMLNDSTIITNWVTFSIMAAIYIKMELFEKAHECLKEIEGRILGRDRVPFHYLLSLYGSIGNKDEVYRVWNNYKTIFPSIPNLGYHAVISSLVRMNDIEGAEKLYEEWVTVRPSDDSRVANLIIGWYLKNGELDKAFSFFEHMIEGGGCPNSTTWEILCEGHIAEKRISDALSCLKKAFVVTSDSTNWKPKPVILAAFLKLCRDEDDMESAEVLIELLRQSGYHKDEAYASLIGKDEPSSTIERIDDIGVYESMSISSLISMF